jgi:transposase
VSRFDLAGARRPLGVGGADAPRPQGERQGRSPSGGRPHCFNAIVFVLFTGIAWRHLPREMGCSPATAHRRLSDWQRAGVFERLHRELLRKLNGTGKIDWGTAVIDGSRVRALQGGLDMPLAGRPCPHRLKAPPDHRFRRVPLAIPDRRQPQRRHPALALGGRDRPVAGKVGRPRKRSDRLLADRGYDHDKYRRELRKRGVSRSSPPGRRARVGPRQAEMGGRAQLRLAPQLPPPAHPLRAAPRVALGVHAAGLRGDLPARPSSG